MSIACVSGYFDPIHKGHIEYFKLSKNIADKLMVIVNNDEQAILKKGKYFMPVDERIQIIKELKCVDYVIKSIDFDRTVCKTLETVTPRPTYFCNGGDQNNSSALGLWFGNRVRFDRKNHIYWQLKHQIERNNFSGESESVDPLLQSTIKGSSVTNSTSFFQLGFTWGR